MSTDWTAERWYEERKKYDPSVKQIETSESREMAYASRPQSSTVTMQDRVKLISLLLLAGILCISIIISTAYVASVRFEINTINSQSATLQGEIENLNVRIKNATNIKTIEEKAANELGMIYPQVERFVFIQSNEKPQGDFAMRLKVQAYNLHHELEI